ncbi:capsular biosynthesis protein [Geobacillus thermocatenulatus]|uniref:Capsular biosynthesis protein n=1 Tax=Geobacillus thermocatenulatus TaxID=33938 RepID=A0A226QBX3_9BACL|nr:MULTISPECIES: CapA family protein [Geobacillus]ASS99268.1 capsular biosynthesis protein [Geobacillus thermocatenulatus]KLR73321.1 capsular biosynthesis protein [Geobacillus sp. T6]OXB90001.1 capsular biosynthesis protein [Geobacillus thermocatenulatus]
MNGWMKGKNAALLCMASVFLFSCNNAADRGAEEVLAAPNEPAGQTIEHPPLPGPVDKAALALAATKQAAPKPSEVRIVVSAAGDVTLGRDENYGYAYSFDEEAKKHGLRYFTKYIEPIFKKDDFTTVNLETTLTTSTRKASKTFRFRGHPSYAKILTYAGIDAVNLANNHTYDYLQKGYNDTIANLKKEKIGYFGRTLRLMKTVKGIQIGTLGYEGWSNTSTLRKQIAGDIRALRNQGADLVLVHFHWGVERSYVPNSTQKAFGRFAIDSGADLVVGHHPHVIQGIEEYKGKFIVYSLGNFMFGGNKNPSDKDTFVFQQVFSFQNGKRTAKKEIRVIPFRISSVTTRNNYQPMPLAGGEAARVKRKIVSLSAKIKKPTWTAYEVK